jgi:hypothetical protein
VLTPLKITAKLESVEDGNLLNDDQSAESSGNRYKLSRLC